MRQVKKLSERGSWAELRVLPGAGPFLLSPRRPNRFPQPLAARLVEPREGSVPPVPRGFTGCETPGRSVGAQGGQLPLLPAPAFLPIYPPGPGLVRPMAPRQPALPSPLPAASCASPSPRENNAVPNLLALPHLFKKARGDSAASRRLGAACPRAAPSPAPAAGAAGARSAPGERPGTGRQSSSERLYTAAGWLPGQGELGTGTPLCVAAALLSPGTSCDTGHRSQSLALWCELLEKGVYRGWLFLFLLYLSSSASEAALSGSNGRLDFRSGSSRPGSAGQL